MFSVSKYALQNGRRELALKEKQSSQQICWGLRNIHWTKFNEAGIMSDQQDMCHIHPLQCLEYNDPNITCPDCESTTIPSGLSPIWAQLCATQEELS